MPRKFGEKSAKWKLVRVKRRNGSEGEKSRKKIAKTQESLHSATANLKIEEKGQGTSPFPSFLT